MNETNSNDKKQFVLVHGFGHGAWCWYKLVSLLKQDNRHRVTALDLAGCGVHPSQLHQISSFSDYARPLMDFLSAFPDDERVVLVGHSYGGISISVAAETFPGKVSLAVFVTAYMPNCTDPPGAFVRKFVKRTSDKSSFMDCEFAFDPEFGELPISAALRLNDMADTVYSHCQLEDVELAKMLLRPNFFFVKDLSKPGLLSQERYGKVKRCYVICEEDDASSVEFQRHNIEENPPDVVVSITEAGHMVMLTRPQELCHCLLDFELNSSSLNQPASHNISHLATTITCSSTLATHNFSAPRLSLPYIPAPWLSTPDSRLKEETTEEEDAREKEKHFWITCEPVDHLVVFRQGLLVVTQFVVQSFDFDGLYVDDADPSQDVYQRGLPSVTADFLVYQYDPEDKDFEYVKSLGGLAIFVGHHSDAVALPVAEYLELKPNSIYFTDVVDDLEIEDHPTGGHAFSITRTRLCRHAIIRVISRR
ncbi:methyl esterase 10 [Striga hermonthica]|uniref:Methyl esterase 10 n=1 Tax=Striga hermonthica TaxID=68872 RepID=A0A9N7NP89_STRHE|nr:methyl esterase 10 [Striga hermonthica]